MQARTLLKQCLKSGSASIFMWWHLASLHNKCRFAYCSVCACTFIYSLLAQRTLIKNASKRIAFKMCNQFIYTKRRMSLFWSVHLVKWCHIVIKWGLAAAWQIQKPILQRGLLPKEKALLLDQLARRPGALGSGLSSISQWDNDSGNLRGNAACWSDGGQVCLLLCSVEGFILFCWGVWACDIDHNTRLLLSITIFEKLVSDLKNH